MDFFSAALIVYLILLYKWQEKIAPCESAFRTTPMFSQCFNLMQFSHIYHKQTTNDDWAFSRMRISIVEGVFKAFKQRWQSDLEVAFVEICTHCGPIFFKELSMNSRAPQAMASPRVKN